MARTGQAGAAGEVSAGRVIAGTARGIRLIGPGEGTRPLGDRLKQSLFAILEPRIRGQAFLDLYAGSGAAGIEALSRGASRAVFVERDRKATRAIERNLEATGLAGSQAVVSLGDVGAWLARATGLARDRQPGAPGAFAVAFVDPPYDAPTRLDATLADIAAAGPDGIVARDGVVVAKHALKTELAPPPLLRSVRRERFGDTILTFLRWADEVVA